MALRERHELWCVGELWVWQRALPRLVGPPPMEAFYKKTPATTPESPENYSGAVFVTKWLECNAKKASSTPSTFSKISKTSPPRPPETP
jgi:hypothetical protein